MELNQGPNKPRQIDHLELSETVYNQILAHLSNTPYKHSAPIIQLMTQATVIVYQDQLGRPNPLGPGVPRGRIVDKPEDDESSPGLTEPDNGEEEREHVPIMTLQECADAEQADEKVANSGAGGAQ